VPWARLTRDIVSFPELIAQTNMDLQSANRLREELSAMVLWMAKPENIARYLGASYENQTHEYQDRVSNRLVLSIFILSPFVRAFLASADALITQWGSRPQPNPEDGGRNRRARVV
jgi:hypothetical protein